MKEAIIAGVTGVLTYYITSLLFKLFDFHYSVLDDKFDLLLFLIDFGSFIIIFQLIFKVLTRLFAKGK
ncbi:hypothetical protein [Neobacillus sp. Marseille-QA0830]